MKKLNKKSEELKECPACHESQIKLIEWPADSTICEITCMNCHLNTGAKFTKNEAIIHWNTRPQEVKLEAIIRELLKALEFYSGDNWKDNIPLVYINGEFLPDNGDIAKQTLLKVEQMEKGKQ